MTTTAAAVKGAEEFISISLQSLRVDTMLDFDLYIRIDGDYVLYRATNMPFSEKTRQLLLEHGVKDLYVSSKNRDGYQKYIETHIQDIIDDDTIGETAKATILYDTAKLMMIDVFIKPAEIKNIERGMALVETTVQHSLRSRNAFHNMLRVMAFDYTTYTHSVNVCTFALALAQFTGIDKPEDLRRLGVGALLHDVGKTRIPEPILHKKGALTPDEWKLVEKHPQWGFEIILETDLIPHESHYPILQHHERECGSGYPHGLKAGEIHPYGKIVAIADAFDAMTTQRVYRHAVDSFPALKEMHEDRNAFDKELLDQFTRMMGGQEQRPLRSPRLIKNST